MAARRSSNKGTKNTQTFEFAYLQKRYVIRQPYQGKPTTIVTTDGLILKVRTWQIGLPFEARPETVEHFDPQAQEAATLATLAGGFVAELIVQPEEAK